uniref:F-box domain-containing protein n=1 Tax=Syphacia muris TaxID=451379 RepID=A0A158R5C8_9BILA
MSLSKWPVCMEKIEPDSNAISSVPSSSSDRSAEVLVSCRKNPITSSTFACGNPDEPDDEIVQAFRQLLKKSTAEQKKILIWELLCSCDCTSLDYASSLIDEMHRQRVEISHTDPFAKLPPVVVLRILHFVDPKTLCNCLRVCRTWKELCSIPYIWKELCLQRPTFRMCSEEAEQLQLQRHTSPDGTVHWKEAFSERYRLYRNWHAGRCVVRTFQGHSQGISCVQFDDERIVSGSSDGTIRLWDIRDRRSSTVYGRLGTMTLTGHSDIVRCLHLNGSRLASGSNDCTIKIWNLAVNTTWSSIACRQTMVGHTNFVRCLQMEDDRLTSGSYDHLLKIWSVATGQCTETLSGHTGGVLCLQSDGTKLVSGSADLSIKCWDERTCACFMTLHNAHEDAVTCLRFDNQRIVSGSVDRTIKMWDIRTGRCISTLGWKLSEGHTGVVRCLQVDVWRLVSAADDRTIKVWNLNTGERLCTLRNHTDGVTCLQFNDQQIVSGSYDRTVKLWDFSVAENFH